MRKEGGTHFKLPNLGDDNVQLALQSNFAMMKALSVQIKKLEKSVTAQVSHVTEFELLKTTDGIGDTLAHKLARACYYIMAKGVSFDENKLFA